MRILTIGDVHFKKDNKYETDKLAEELQVTIDKREPDIIIILGDIMHYHNVSYVDVFIRAKKFLIKLSKLRRTYVLMGNHDYKSNRVANYQEHYFVGMNTDRLTIIDTPISINGIYLCPYVKEGYLWNIADKDEVSKSSIAFFHQEFKGAELRPGLRSEVGDEWPDDFPLAISGHIHSWHMPSPNICYIGTPFQHNFSPYPERKTVSIFDNGNKSDNREWEQTRIDLNIPQKICIKIDCGGFSRYEYDECSSIKFKIVDTSRKINAMKRTEKYIQFASNPKIKFLLTSKDDVSIVDLSMPKTITTYWQKLEQRIKQCDETVQELFFATIRTNTG